MALQSFAPAVFAYDRIMVVADTDHPASAAFVRELKKDLAPQGEPKFAIDVVKPSGKPAPSPGQLVVAVGVQALQAAAGTSEHTAILGVLVPQQSYDAIKAALPTSRNLSAITLDQPLPRQLALLRHTLPQARTIGVLLGPSSTAQADALEQAAPPLAVVSEHAEAELLLLPALKQVLAASDVLLSLPDPRIFNRNTAQTILLTSYRYQKPVIGFSKAYVTAGALAAVFSTPQQIARQAAELILALDPGQAALPSVSHPRYFSVAVNHQVARSLGIEIRDESALTELLRSEEETP